MAERFNQTLENALVMYVNDHQDNWDEFLDPILLAYQTSIKKSTGVTFLRGSLYYLTPGHYTIQWRYDPGQFINLMKTI